MCYGLGDYKSPGLIGRTFFTTDFKSVGTPNGGVERLVGGFQIRRDGKGRRS